ncbi:MAG: DUF1315 family protein [Gammaproteobacteria bacterium]|nr:DUF1315 family protein [Gammaproteobacteria bacterium]
MIIDEPHSTTPKTMEELISRISPEIYENLKEAIGTGKWSDGKKLNKPQLEHCIQIIILYESKFLSEEEKTGARLADCQSQRDILSTISLMKEISGEEG